MAQKAPVLFAALFISAEAPADLVVLLVIFRCWHLGDKRTGQA